jgi:hypothetical protein
MEFFGKKIKTSFANVVCHSKVHACEHYGIISIDYSTVHDYLYFNLFLVSSIFTHIYIVGMVSIGPKFWGKYVEVP